MVCTRCDGTGFLNLEQVPQSVDEAALNSDDWYEAILSWANTDNNHDVSVCDCCGNGEEWYGEPGQHSELDCGMDGPYAYNGGLPECW